jgi:hypothetical protein
LAGKGPLCGSLGKVPSSSGSLSLENHKALKGLVGLLTRAAGDCANASTSTSASA